MKISGVSLTGLGALAFLVSSASAAGEPARLIGVDPFRMEVQATGSPRRITIVGENFEDVGHPNRDEYMHWQIRRDDGGWQLCAQWNIASAAGICHSVGWSAGEVDLEIGGNYTVREGFIELRVFHGLADDEEIDPHRAMTPTEWSNIVRVPVVVPGPPPTIRSLSRSTFPTVGAASDYQFVIDAGGLVGQPVVVFRGDTVVWPERIYDGHNIQVTVPEIYRLTTSGELPLTVRTDKGGNSAETFIRFVEPPRLTVSRGPPRRSTTPPIASGAPTPETSVGRGGVAVSIPGVNTSGRCVEGFVWREVTPADHVCVTPETRARTARQNQEAMIYRLPNVGAYGPNTCVPGFVWRDAVADDVVCVTPADRAQAAEDNRLAPSRVAD